MTNGYYNHTTFPATSSAGSSALARAEFDAITNGFALLPALAGNGNDGLFVDNAGATITASGAWKLSGANLVATGSITASSFIGSLTGSAATLNPGRLINGVLFDGSANITVAGTDSTKVLKAGDTMTGLLTTTAVEGVRIVNSGGIISGYDNTNTTRTGYVAFNAGGYVALTANTGATNGIQLNTNGGSLSVAQSGAVTASSSVTAASFSGPLTGAASSNVLKAGDTMTGPLTATPAEAVRIANSGGYISGYDNTNTTRTGYLQFNAGGYVQLTANLAATNGIFLNTNGGSLAIAQSGAVTASSSVTAASFSGPLTGAASSNVLKAGDTMTGPLTAPGFSGPLTGAASSNVLKTGDTMTGPLTAPSFAGNVNVTGGSGNLTMAGAITRFESAELASPTVTGLFGATHGGPRKPDAVQAVMRCKIAEGGWNVGDELTLADMNTDASRAYQTYRNASSCGVIVLAAGGTIGLRSTTGVLFAATSANWRLVFYCTWL